MVGDDDIPDFSDKEVAQDRTMVTDGLRLGPHVGQKPWLLVVGGKRCVGMLFEVRNGMTIGRAAPADVVLNEEGVSRQHARIEVVAGVVRVSDLASSNGVRLGGRRVKINPLRDGERLRLGDAVLTLVHMDDNTSVVTTNLRASVDALAKVK